MLTTNEIEKIIKSNIKALQGTKFVKSKVEKDRYIKLYFQSDSFLSTVKDIEKYNASYFNDKLLKLIHVNANKKNKHYVIRLILEVSELTTLETLNQELELVNEGIKISDLKLEWNEGHYIVECYMSSDNVPWVYKCKFASLRIEDIKHHIKSQFNNIKETLGAVTFKSDEDRYLKENTPKNL